MNPKIAILGAGPIGLEAALAVKRRGGIPLVYEQGEPGNSVRAWGHVRMFSPFGMNSSEAGRELVASSGHPLPRLSERVRARRFLEDYLAPLAAQLGVRGGRRVTALRSDPSGKGFLVECEGAGGKETEHADFALDCSGSFDCPIRLAVPDDPSGAARYADRIHYGLPDVSGALRKLFAGGTILVAGAGYSGATVVRDLCAVRLRHPETRILWIAKRGVMPPVPLIPSDPIEAREALARHVNELVRLGEIDFRPAHQIAGIERVGDRLRVVLDNAGRKVLLEVDRIVATLGFSPCETVSRGLRLDLCEETGAASQIARELSKLPSDQHAFPHRFPPDAVRHPEPGYFRLGSKSFGMLPGFLIATGLHQIQLALDAIFGEGRG